MREPTSVAAATVRPCRRAPASASGLAEKSHEDLMRALGDVERVRALLGALRAHARRRHGIRAADVDDIFQDSVATYLLVNRRYPADANHFGLLYGIFHRRSLMFLHALALRRRAGVRLAERLRGRRPEVARGEDPCGTTLDRLVRDESASRIRGAISSIAAERRDLLLAFAESAASRLELIAATAINPDTFDSRLRSARLRLQRTLRAADVA